ncbi:hypothetical protein FSP39_013389 [Pinctada imbricata]|uniref:B30.2/SPRY domain-containing protein n=1 Tax=Pinctada imbricata TaxID=66713 RepID=A0AA88Y4M5_PINIB|nr:hypothetical protein FSP39_013389 [Pinctada imbricata]
MPGLFRSAGDVIYTNNSKITIGIAGPDIAEDAKPGYWNNTVGYSNNGKCLTSHSASANTSGEKFGIGDVFGVFVNYFGKQMSMVTFVKNGLPVATRYHYESDHDKFLPTITLENGPIDLGMMWPEAALGKPMFKDHYEVIVKDTSPSGAGPAVGLGTCSPLKPVPTCEKLRDYFRWMADGDSNKTKVNQRIGMGIHYNPKERENPNFNERESQLVLCFVTLDTTIVYATMMIQPEGGFYPLVLLNKNSRKVSLDVEGNRTIKTFKILDDQYYKALLEANKGILDDSLKRRLSLEMFRKSAKIKMEVLEQTKIPDSSKQHCRVNLSKNDIGIHVIQFKQPVTADNPYFCVEIRKLHEDSVISIGIADHSFPENKHPGKLQNSTGYMSRDGKMYYSGLSEGNLMGERYEEGDTVGLEMSNFDRKYPIVLFSKNQRPIGTRFLHLTEPDTFLPTVALCGNGYDVEIDIFWQNQYCMGPSFDVHKPESWCLPKNAEVDDDNRMIYVSDHTNPVIIQCPHALDIESKFDYFEIELVDKFGDEVDLPPPGIALTSACFQSPNITSSSNFRQDFIRFLAIGEAQHSVKVGQKIGWGILEPESEKDKKEDKLLICYLTIDRNIAITRVIYEPPGGFYPVLMLLDGVNRVKLGKIFHIYSHPVSKDTIHNLLADAQKVIEEEKRLAAEGKDPQDLVIDKKDLFRTLSSPEDEKKKDDPLKMSSVVKAAKLINDKKKENQKSKSCVIL